MTNAEYYKNCSFDDLLIKFIASCSDKQTIHDFNEWRNAEHYQLILGDVILRKGNESMVEIVVAVNPYTHVLTLRPIASYLANEPSLDKRIGVEKIKLYTGKALFNIVDALSKDSTKHYHYVSTYSRPIIKTSKSSEAMHTLQANKSKKDKILDYMEKVMLIDSFYIDRLRKQSVKEICTHTFRGSEYIFSVLYRVSPCKHNTLSAEFMSTCHHLAPKWYVVRKNCYKYEYIIDVELNAMLDFGTVGYTGNKGTMYNINSEIVDVSK